MRLVQGWRPQKLQVDVPVKSIGSAFHRRLLCCMAQAGLSQPYFLQNAWLCIGLLVTEQGFQLSNSVLRIAISLQKATS